MTPMEQSERKGLVARWRKKTTIEAVQWFSNGHCPVWAQDAVEEAGDRFTIRTREGVLTGIPGDWIARGIEGEVYPIGPDIFAKTYEPADLSSRPVPMAEDVANATARLRNLIYGDAGKSDLDIVSAHIDDLTRTVAEAEAERGLKPDWGRAVPDELRRFANALIDAGWPQGATLHAANEYIAARHLTPLSRPQETDAEREFEGRDSLDEYEDIEACYDAALDLFLRENDGAQFANAVGHRVALKAVHDAAARSRPSPGPATETDRKEGWWVMPEWRHVRGEGDAAIWELKVSGEAVGEVYHDGDHWRAYRIGDGTISTEATPDAAKAVLLASVRPKQEGV